MKGATQESDLTIELDEKAFKELRDITIVAFKHDLANNKDEGFDRILERVQQYLPQDTVFPKDTTKLKEEYQKCKQDYQDTHIRGVGKGVGGAVKTAGAMAMRFLKAAFGSVGVVIGVPIMAVSALGSAIDGGGSRSISGMLMDIGIGFAGTGGKAIDDVYQKNIPAKRIIDKIRSR